MSEAEKAAGNAGRSSNSSVASNSVTASVPRKRHRKTTSCQSCRERRKACDGVVPCGPCISRRVGHLCKWGDERDRIAISLAAPPDTPETDSTRTATVTGITLPPSTPDSISKKDSDAGGFSRPSDLANTLAQADLSTTEDCPPSKGAADSHQVNLTSRQARHLIDVFHRHVSFGGLLLVDYSALYACCPLDSDAIARSRGDGDVLALLLFVCASSLHSLPPSLSISLGLASHFEETNDVASAWTYEALALLEACDVHMHPTLAAVQALMVYQYNLVHRGRASLMVSQLDTVIRAARVLGLDRLDSLDNDERIWREADARSHLVDDEERRGAQLPSHASADWAAQTLRRRDMWAREIGRSLWCLLVNRDWAASRQMGSYLIHPGSFTTAPPRMRAKRGVGEHRGKQDSEDPWQYMLPVADILRRFHDICAEAAAASLSGRISHDAILGLDAELEAMLARRPAWLRPEAHPTAMGSDDVTVLVDARGVEVKSPFIGSIISTTIWHRLFSIHRPFLALGLSQPEKYGLSERRSFSKAMLFLQVSRQNSQEGMLVVHQSVTLSRLLQAALVIITHLLLGSSASVTNMKHCDPGWLDPMRVHAYLSYVITTFHSTAYQSSKRQTDKAGASHYTYEGVAGRLESLVGACARLTSDERHLYPSEASAQRASLAGGLSATQANDIDNHLYLLADPSMHPPAAPLPDPMSTERNNATVTAPATTSAAALAASLSTVDNNLWDELSRMLQEPGYL